MQKTFCDWCEESIPKGSKVHRITENHKIDNEVSSETENGGVLVMSQMFGGDSLNEPRLELCDDCGIIRANLLANTKSNIHELKKHLKKQIKKVDKKNESKA